MTSVEHGIARLGAMTPAELRAAWRDTYRAPAPALLSPELLARGIAYRLQERMLGGLAAETKRVLVRAAQQLARTGSIAASALRIKSGTRLVRSWRGRTLSVLVRDDGFELDGKRYGSLSEIAKDVTGTSWSGPKFFGLKSRRAARHG